MTDYLTVSSIRDAAPKVRYSDVKAGDVIAQPRMAGDHATFQTFTQAAVAIAKGRTVLVDAVEVADDGTLTLTPAGNGALITVPAHVAGTRTLLVES